MFCVLVGVNVVVSVILIELVVLMDSNGGDINVVKMVFVVCLGVMVDKLLEDYNKEVDVGMKVVL